MKNFLKYLLLLFFLLALLNIIWFIIISVFNTKLSAWHFPSISGMFFLATTISLFVFFRGLQKSPREETMHSFISVSLKFVLELVLALIWFALMKKTGWNDILLFFMLYLAFSITGIFIILKSLKNKILKA